MSLIDLLIPPRCVCTKPVSRNFLLCSECWKSLDFIIHTCEKCHSPLEQIPITECKNCLNPVYGKSVVMYKGVATKMITHFKYYKRYMYGTMMAHYMVPLVKDLQFDMIIAIPISFRRLLWRGYHHTAVLAQGVSKFTGKPLLTNCLKKRHTKRQVDCDKEERLENVQDSFFINPKKLPLLKGKKILLVDDVITTGSTIYECGKILRNNGAAQVSFVTFARS
jgi:competence protein ComFC